MLMDAKEFEFLYSTVIIFGLITFGIYLCLLKPLLAPSNGNNDAAAQAQAARAAAIAAAARRHGGANGADSLSFALHNHGGGTSSTASTGLLGGSGLSNSSNNKNKSTRWPPHVTTSHASVVDGLVAFRHTKAAASTATARSDDDTTTNTKERARIMSKLFLTSSGSGSVPTLPPKGSTWILSLPSHLPNDGGETDTSTAVVVGPVLRVLATHYNLLVILSLNSNVVPADSVKKTRLEWIQQLRQPQHFDKNDAVRSSSTQTSSSFSGVGNDLLPSHRIVASTTPAGRVAFVRQVQRVGMILDFDESVQEQLARFGHKVVVYDPRRLNY